MIWVVLALLAGWLLVLSLVVWGLAKNAATWELARHAGPIPRLQYDFDADGPVVGSPIPTEVLEFLSARAPDLIDDGLLFVFSPGCGTCLEVASDVARRSDVARKSVFVAVGPTTTGAATELRSVLARAERPILDGDDARSVMRALNINSIPFVVRVRRGTVIRKAFLRKSVNLDELVLDDSADILTEIAAQAAN